MAGGVKQILSRERSLWGTRENPTVFIPCCVNAGLWRSRPLLPVRLVGTTMSNNNKQNKTTGANCLSQLEKMDTDQGDSLEQLEAQLDSKSLENLSSCPSINLDTPKNSEMEDSDEDDRVSVTIKTSRGSTVANPEQSQQMDRIKLSGAGKKRLKKLLDQGYDKDEAYRLAYRPSVQSEPSKRPRDDLSSGEKPQPKKTKGTSTPTGRPHKDHSRKSLATSSVNIRLQRQRDPNFQDGRAEADAVHMQPGTSKVANKTNEDAERSKPGKLKVPGKQAKAGSCSQLGNTKVPDRKTEAAAGRSQPGKPKVPGTKQKAKTAHTLPGNIKVPGKGALAVAESRLSRNLKVPDRKTKPTATQNPLYTEVVSQVRIGIIPKDYPTTALTTQQLILVQDTIINKVVENRGTDVKPIFRGCTIKTGFLVINCHDQATADWLKRITPSLLVCEGVELIAVDEKNIPRSEILVAYLPKSATKSNEQIMAFIESQNDMDTDSWRILQRSSPNGNDVELVLTVNEDSMQKLTRWGFQINYLYHTAKLRRVKKSRIDKQDSNTDCREVQDMAMETEVASMIQGKDLGNTLPGPQVDQQQQIPGPSPVNTTGDECESSSKTESQEGTAKTNPKKDNNRGENNSSSLGMQKKVPEISKESTTKGTKTKPTIRQSQKSGSSTQ